MSLSFIILLFIIIIFELLLAYGIICLVFNVCFGYNHFVYCSKLPFLSLSAPKTNKLLNQPVWFTLTGNRFYFREQNLSGIIEKYWAISTCYYGQTGQTEKASMLQRQWGGWKEKKERSRYFLARSALGK